MGGAGPGRTGRLPAAGGATPLTRIVHLDTNDLILALVPGTPQDQRLRGWPAASEPVNLSSVAWAEFLCGPLTDEPSRLASALFPRPEPFLAEDAARAADFFNRTGRRRGSLLDCMIASAAVRAGAALATENLGDFRPFVPLGLQLLDPP